MDSIISIVPYENGRHSFETTSGYYREVPDKHIRMTREQLIVVLKYKGFVNVEQLEDGGVEITPNIPVFEKWTAAELEPEPEPEPTETEQLRADVDYLSAMLGVTL